MPMLKSKTFLNDFSNDINTYFIVQNEGMYTEFSGKLKAFFNNLFSSVMDRRVVKQFARWIKSDGEFYMNVG